MTKTEKIKDKFIKAFRNGEDFKPILNEHKNSKSILYRGMALAFNESYHEFRELKDRYITFRKEVHDLTEKRDRLTRDTEKLEPSSKKLNQLQKRVAKASDKLIKLERQWTDLTETKGITLEQMNRISEIEFKTGKKLLERVKNAAEYQKMLDKKEALESAIYQLKTKLDSLQKEYDNTLLKFKKFKSAVKVVVPFMEQGYTTEHFNLILDGLYNVGILGQQEASITRLLQAIRICKNIVEIDEELDRKRLEKTELEEKIKTLTQELTEVEAKLESIKNHVLKVTIDSIQEMTNYSRSKLEETSQAFGEFVDQKKKEIDACLGWAANYDELQLARVLSLGHNVTKADLEKIIPRQMANYLASLRYWVQAILPEETIRIDDVLLKEMRFFVPYNVFPLKSIISWLERRFGSLQI